MLEKDHEVLMEIMENIVHKNDNSFLTVTEDRKPALNLLLCGRRGAEKTSAAKAILGPTAPVSSDEKH